MSLRDMFDGLADRLGLARGGSVIGPRPLRGDEVTATLSPGGLVGACPTRCEPGCPEVCHEVHYVCDRREHDPWDHVILRWRDTEGPCAVCGSEGWCEPGCDLIDPVDQR